VKSPPASSHHPISVCVGTGPREQSHHRVAKPNLPLYRPVVGEPLPPCIGSIRWGQSFLTEYPCFLSRSHCRKSSDAAYPWAVATNTAKARWTPTLSRRFLHLCSASWAISLPRAAGSCQSQSHRNPIFTGELPSRHRSLAFPNDKPFGWAPIISDLPGALLVSSWGLCYMGSARHKSGLLSLWPSARPCTPSAKRPRSRARCVYAHGSAQLHTVEPCGLWLGCGPMLFKPFPIFWIDLNGFKLVQFVQRFIGKWIEVRKI
jgi:hypothetical protein